MTMASIMCFLLWDTFMTPPEEQWLKRTNVEKFLTWVQLHPYWGLGAFLIAIASCVIFMIPVGTPLTLGAGYIYKGVYGWTIGIVVGTAVSVLGSALGAVSCFLLGRYLMRERVRKWIRKYPLFDAIDVAVSEQGLRIMAMLYLTPVLPLGPVSYMCGTTSMALSSFALAKVASLPLMIFYVYLGAATGTLLSGGSEAEQIEENKTLICIGIVLSAVMITCISHRIRKELDKILERQKKGTSTNGRSVRPSSNTDDVIELGMAKARHRRPGVSTTTSCEVLGGECVLARPVELEVKQLLFQLRSPVETGGCPQHCAART
jgi:uncharacterized membrane protein YdjX (TVP38/TMEM64 family)